MDVQNFISRVRSHLERQRRFRAAVAEINAMSDRDLADFRGNRHEMLHAARRDILG